MNANRAMRLLGLLDEGEFRTAAQLAEELGRSDKTVRTSLRDLGVLLEGNGARVVSKARHGYRLEVLDRGRFEAFASFGGGSADVPESTEERVDYLILGLLYLQGYVKAADLCEALFVSSTTLSAALKQVEAIFSEYGISIERRPNHGMRACGSEIDMRRLIIDRYMGREHLPRELGEGDARERMGSLASVVKGLIARHGVRLSEFAFDSFVSYAYVAWDRILSGFALTADFGEMPDIRPGEHAVAEGLLDALGVSDRLEDAVGERRYLELYLAGKRIVGSIAENDANFVITEKADCITLEILSLLSSDYDIDLLNNFDLRMSLNQHLAPMDIRLRYDIESRNPMLDQIKENYPLAFQMATLAGGVLKRHYGCDVPEGELGYIALILQLGVEKWKRERKRNILIVCDAGKSSARLLRYRFEQKFKDALERIYTCDMLELERFDFELVDYVFTTAPIAISVPKPIMQVDRFLKDDDVSRVDHVLRNGSVSGIARRFIGPERFFAPGTLASDRPASSKDDVLEELCGRICAAEDVDERFYELVLERETFIQMRLNNEVALPHPNGIASTSTFAYVAVLEHAVPWDDDTARVVILVSMGSSDEGDEARPVLNESLARFVLDGGAVRCLVEAPDFQTLEALLEG